MTRAILKAIGLFFLTMVLLYPMMSHARDDGRYAQSPLNGWVKSLKDKRGISCCDTADGFPAEVEWDTKGERYRVRIEGEWYDVPADAVLEQPNRLGYPMVWFTWQYENSVKTKPLIRCFIAGAGG